MATLAAVGFLVVFVIYLMMDNDAKDSNGCLMLLVIFAVVVVLCMIEALPGGMRGGFPKNIK